MISAAGPTFMVEEEADKQNEKDKKAWKKTCEKIMPVTLSSENRAKPSYALVRTPVKENGLESTFFHKEEFCQEHRIVLKFLPQLLCVRSFRVAL